MRKFLMLLLIIHVTYFVQNVHAQNCNPNSPYGYYQYGPSYAGGPLPTQNGTGTSSYWASYFTTYLGLFGISIGQLFSMQNNYSNSYYPGFGGSIYPTGYFNQYQILGSGGGSSSSPGTPDCYGVVGGTAKKDVCGICVGGTTGVDSCNKPNANDTLKPEKKTCPTEAIARDTMSDHILDYIKETPIMKNARDSAPFKNFEVGFSIYRYSNPTGTSFNYVPKNYNTAGVGQTVSIINTSTYSVADLHVHPDSTSNRIKLDESPSPVDIGRLVDQYLDPSFNKKFQRKYVISGGPTRGEFAVVISDTAKVRQFNLLHPFDSTFNTDVNSPTQGNWIGTDSSGFYKRYLQAYKKFESEGYPKTTLETYANVYLLNTLNVGVVLQQKIDGKFKELSFVEETDPTDITKKRYRIKICE